MTNNPSHGNAEAGIMKPPKVANGQRGSASPDQRERVRSASDVSFKKGSRKGQYITALGDCLPPIHWTS